MTLKRKTPLKAKKSLRTKKPCVTVEQMMSSGLLARGSTFSSKPKRIKPRAAKKPGAKTQMEVFQQIWDASEDKCCEVCGTGIASMNPINFSHLLPKGSYRKYKFDVRNLVLKCAECHRKWHDFGPHRLVEDPRWASVCNRWYELLREANGL